jgi:hypothetical protein
MSVTYPKPMTISQYAADLYSAEIPHVRLHTTKDEDLGAHLQACQALSQGEQARWAALPGDFHGSCPCRSRDALKR